MTQEFPTHDPDSKSLTELVQELEAVNAEHAFLSPDSIRVAKGIEIRDITSEMSRAYHYGDRHVIIYDPVVVQVRDSGAHIVVTNRGEVNYLPAGWDYITWMVKPGRNHIDF